MSWVNSNSNRMNSHVIGLKEVVKNAATTISTVNEKRRRRRGAKANEAALQNSAKQKRQKVNDEMIEIAKNASKNSNISKQNDESASVTIKTSNDISSEGLRNSGEVNTISKKSRRKRGKAPKPGEEGYLTPSQLRNARKRRSKQRKALVSQGKNENTVSQTLESRNNIFIPTSGDGKTETMNGVDKKIKQKKKSEPQQQHVLDPSARYLHNPRSAPIVRKAIRYFQNKTPSSKPFQVFLNGPTRHWRTVSKLAARTCPISKAVKIGLFLPNSHSILSIPDSPVHHPSINCTVKILEKICNKCDDSSDNTRQRLVEPYDEITGEGYLRYVCINVERSTGAVQITLVWNSSPNEKHGNNGKGGEESLDKLIDAILSSAANSEKKTESIKLHSLWVHYNTQWKHSNTIFDYGTSQSNGNSNKNLTWKLVHGPPDITESLDLSSTNSGYSSTPVKLHFPPNVFRQANIDAFTHIIVAIRNRLIRYNAEERDNQNSDHKKFPSCLELYGGVGTIGLNLHDLTNKITSSDENPNNASCFLQSVKELMETIPNKSERKRNRFLYISKNASAMVTEELVFRRESGHRCEIAVVDPPRKGLEEAVVNALTAKHLKNDGGIKLLVYVSCGFDAFERDCNSLLASGNWKLDHAEGHILFPGSDAIETLAFFTRA